MVILNFDSLAFNPKKWLYPLTLLVEDGRTLILQSTLGREKTRSFLRKHSLLELFDDIRYTDHETSTVTELRHLPPLCKRQWTRTRLMFCVTVG